MMFSLSRLILNKYKIQKYKIIFFVIYEWAPFSEDTNESQKNEHENDPEEDKAEIKEFLRKVRSHGSFKIIIGK